MPNTLLNSEHLKGTLTLALHAGNYRNERIVLHVAVVILLVLALVIISHRQKQAKLFRNLYESERKQREALNALSRSEERFGLMVQNTTDIIGTINRDGIVTYVSPTVERVTGFKPEELLVSFMEVVYADDIPIAVEAFNDLVKNPGANVSIALRMKCKDGGFKYVEAVAQNFLDVPLVGAIVYNARDITEHKQSEKALKQSEELYHSLFDNMLNGFAHCRMLFENGLPSDFIYLDVNQAFESLTGLKNVVGRSVSEVIPNIRESDAELFDIYGRVALTGKPERFETFVEALQMWFSISVYSPAKEHFVAVFDVITERKRAEKELKASELRFRSIFDQVTDGILIADPDTGAFIIVNQAICDMLGYSDQELLDRRVKDIHLESDLPKLRATFFPRAQEQAQVTHDLPFRRKDGSVFFADVNSSLINIDGRNLLMGSVRDVTEKRALQASVAQSDRLASMGMLAAGVAHEINNPLSYVLYNVESLVEDLPKLASAAQRCASSLKDRVGDAEFNDIAGDGAELLQPTLLAETVERAREALSGGQRIKVIARGLGTFSRVERVEQSRVDLKYPIECAINMSFNEIKFRARLVKDFGNVPSVFASEGKLSQVFLNLLINAAHSIDEGHADDNRIEIRTWTEEGYVFAEVTDTGKGIPPENLERIFDPFFTTKATGVGSGLGLAICKNIVTEFGGDIQVDSEVGKGTRFRIRLPVHRQNSLEPRAIRGADSLQIPRMGGRILVVDDEPLIRSSIRRILGHEHEVITAASGEEGRAVLEKNSSFDVILCDLMMPNMSGMELHEWVANRDPALARRVMFLTGGAYTPWASEYLSHVGNLRIEKPVESADLKRMVMEKVLECRRNQWAVNLEGS